VIATELLDDLRHRGVQLAPAAGDRLSVEAPSGVLTDADRAALRQHKAELLELLRLPTPPWSETETGRLLTELRQTAEGIRRLDFAGEWPTELGSVVAALLDLAKGYAHDPNALALLRGVRPTLERAVRNWQSRQRSPVLPPLDPSEDAADATAMEQALDLEPGSVFFFRLHRCGPGCFCRSQLSPTRRRRR
jgi:hypothetical protein